MRARPIDEPLEQSTGVPIGTALSSFLDAHGLVAAGTLGSIVGAWPEIVGSAVAEHVTPWRLNADELVVAVDSPAWVTELAFLSEMILATLETRLGYRPAKGLKAHVRPNFGID